MLLKKKEDLVKSLQNLEQQYAQMGEQIVMHKGALQYNEMLLKEMDDAEKAKAEAAKESPVKAVE